MSYGDAIRAAQKPIIEALESKWKVSQQIEYEDLEADPDLRNRIVRWFYTHLKREWLYEDEEFRSLARYFIVKEDKVELVVNSDQYRDPNFKSPGEPERSLKLKLDFIRKYLVSKRRVARILEKYASKHKVKWWDLEDKASSIKHAFYKEFRRKILQSIDAKISLEKIKDKKPDSVIEDEKEGNLWD